MKKNYRNKYVAFIVYFAFILVLSCCDKNSFGGQKKQTLRIVNWNVQTFFDEKIDGTEYDDFKKSKNWNKEAYEKRLQKLCKAIKTLDADVFIMEELENQKVLLDINNFLAGEWNFSKWYVSGCFAKEKDASIGCGVISRFPLENLTVHSLDIKTEAEKMPSMRPLMEFYVCKNGKKLLCMVCHWKSKSGGEEESEKWRNMQEQVLSYRLIEKNEPVLICGDFNRSVEDFSKGNNANEVLLNTGDFLPHKKECVCVTSLWYDEFNNLLQNGSYYYKGQWSKIDNFFYLGKVSIKDFCVETNGPWCNKDYLTPLRYTIWNGNGYSDHLPISCTVEF